MPMKLKRFRVTNFRSVEDSGWIDTGEITALIGTNESGKTNLLVALWKLNPAKDGQINPLADYPRKRYNEIRSMPEKPVFIEAEFELAEELVQELVRVTEADEQECGTVLVQRRLDGQYSISFPKVRAAEVPTPKVAKILAETESSLAEIDATTAPEQALKSNALSQLAAAKNKLTSAQENLDKQALTQILADLKLPEMDGAPRRSQVAQSYKQTISQLEDIARRVSHPTPNENSDAERLVRESLLSFVYYAHYGNLDSEIYLPHVIQNLQRSDLGGREEAKVRTLRVLFEFVRLKPQEILDLGREVSPIQGKPTEDQIKEVAERKKEREVLLQSASSELTDKFRKWWKQGDYRLRFQADGDHFRIWVSDDKRARGDRVGGKKLWSPMVPELLLGLSG